ncbi:uncharacterized protein LOC125658715 [Ostrea edulis]|uniref:uncharacterized protein LOC125658715 n=1 Tax=Ostrea edulis TaxID=37623 RepID=UPI0024AF1AF4|nr:uncharacterized protein LOC125658715 [Ostrea edulis]
MTCMRQFITTAVPIALNGLQSIYNLNVGSSSEILHCGKRKRNTCIYLLASLISPKNYEHCAIIGYITLEMNLLFLDGILRKILLKRISGQSIFFWKPMKTRMQNLLTNLDYQHLRKQLNEDMNSDKNIPLSIHIEEQINFVQHIQIELPSHCPSYVLGNVQVKK